MTARGEASFDHGAQYFTARDPSFRAQVEAWRRQGVVAAWEAAGTGCWVGVPAMNAPVKQLASSASVRWNTRVDGVTESPSGWFLECEATREGPFDAVLLAVPAENAATMFALSSPAMAALATANPAQPCWTVMAAFEQNVPENRDVLREGGPIEWAARNSAKPGRSGPEAWVIQAGPVWSRDHLEQDQPEIAAALLAAFAVRVGAALPPLLTASAHRWRYARSGNAEVGMRWDGALRLGMCGDWLLGPRVECAWLSGFLLAEAVADECAA